MHQNSFHTQAVGQVELPIGSYYQSQPEQLTYPNEEGSAYMTQFGQQDPLPTGPPPEEYPPEEYPPPDLVPPEYVERAKWIGGAWMVASTVSMAASAYHGYKRNQSVGWAIAWALLGGAFPVITPAIAVAQGFGKTKRGR